MADLYGRADQVVRGGLSSDALYMSWPALRNYGLGLLVVQVAAQYNQPVRRIFELGPGVMPSSTAAGWVHAGVCDTGGAYNTPLGAVVGGAGAVALCAYRTQPTYYIIGRAEGRLQLQRFAGPEAIQCEFYRVYGSGCSDNVMQLSGKVGCSSGNVTTIQKHHVWLMTGVVLDNYGMNANSQENVIQESVSAMFSTLKMGVSGDETVCSVSV